MTIAKIWKQSKCPTTDERVSFATTCMDLESIMLSEINQSKTVTICGINSTFMWHLKYKQMNIVKQKQCRRYREQTSGS